MIKLGFLQFRASWRVWITAGVVFSIAGWLIGFCLTGIISLQAVLSGADKISHDPTPLFLMPITFGGMTLFFVLGGVIRNVLKEMQQTYQLWTILGASPTQISFLVAIQLGIIGIIGSFIGYFIGLSTITPLYRLLQTSLGRNWLPPVSFHFSIIVLGLNCGIISLTCFLAGISQTRRGLRQLDMDIHSRQNHFHMSTILAVLAVIGLLTNIMQVLSQTGTHGSYLQMARVDGSPLYLAMVALVVLQLSAGRAFLPRLLAFLTSKLSVCLSPIGGTARRQVLADTEHMTTTIVPILVMQTLVVGLYELLYGFSAPDQVDAKNVVVVFVVYVGAPIILVAANIVSLAMLKGRQQEQNLSRLSQLGFTKRQLFQERFVESALYMLSLSIVAIASNGLLYGLLAIACFKTGITLNVSLSIILTVPVVVAIMTMLILILIDSTVIARSRSIAS